jgi:hypothetical protein
MNDTLQPSAPRPEDRQRGNGESAHWTDTVSLCLRSEGFAEDLLPGGDAEAPLSPWRGAASLPLLGAALAAVLGFAGVAGLGGR